MPLPDAVVAHDLAMRRITAATLLQARRLWAQLGESVDFDTAWRAIGPRLLVLLSAAQLAGARDAIAYTAAVVAELGLPDSTAGAVSAGAFTGAASDGRPLGSLLYEPVISAKALIGQGASVPGALQSGGSYLDRIVTTQVADAGREAAGAAITARPEITGYVRMVNAPCCGRCALLAGRFYRWSAGFQRHPGCHCRNIPSSENVPGDIRTDPKALFDRGRVKGLSQADAQAIKDGADPGQVINAHRGMSTTTAGVKVTTEGTTKRGVARARMGGKQVRLMPSSIYQLAGEDRDLAIKLLRDNGFLLA